MSTSPADATLILPGSENGLPPPTPVAEPSVSAEQKETERMGIDPILSIMLRFALPAIFGLVLHALYNSVDRIFVGQYVSAEALGAITVVFPVQVVFASLGMMVSVGGAALISIALGCQETEKARQVLGNAITLVVGLSAICVGIGLWHTEAILTFFGTSPTLLPMATRYLRILLFGLIFDMVAMSANFYIRATGRPIYGMMTLIIGAVSNILLDWILIVHAGWGLEGAAIATVTAQTLSAIWALSFFIRPKSPLRLNWAVLKLKKSISRQIITVGFSACLMELAFAIQMLLINHTLYPLGGDLAIAAMGIIFTLSLMLFLPIFGLLEGTRPLVGYNYGAKQYDRVLRSIKLTLGMAMGFLAVGFVVYQIFPENLVRIFNTDPELVAVAARGIRISFAAVIIAAVGAVTSCVFQSIAKPLPAVVLSILRSCVFVIIPLKILPPLIGIDGVWWSLVIGDVLSFCLGGWLLMSQWQKFSRLTGKKTAPNGQMVLEAG